MLPGASGLCDMREGKVRAPLTARCLESGDDNSAWLPSDSRNGSATSWGVPMRVRKLILRAALFASLTATPVAFSVIQAPAANADVISDCTNFYYGYSFQGGLTVGNSPNCPAHIWI